MQRAVTAIYRTPAVADLVRKDLEQLGIARHNITVLPDATETSLSTSAGQGSAEDAIYQLSDLGLPEADARTYQQALRNGDYVVSVEVDDEGEGGADLGRVQEIMRKPEDAYDLDELDTRYSAAEYTPPRQPMGGMDSGERTDDGTVKVMEERLSVGKRDVDQGAVRVRSYVREEPVSADVSLRSTRVYLERHPVDRAATAGDLDFRDQTLEAREHSEQAMVSKEARVVEEIGLRTEDESHTETVSDTVRKTEVEIEDERTGETTRIAGDDATRTDRDRF